MHLNFRPMRRIELNTKPCIVSSVIEFLLTVLYNLVFFLKICLISVFLKCEYFIRSLH